MIREVQRIDHIGFDSAKYTASFSGITVPISLISVTEGEDCGRKRLTVTYNGEVYVLRSYTSDAAEITSAEHRIADAVKAYHAACKAHEAGLKKQAREEKRRNGKLAQMKERMEYAQENALRIDKKHGRVHFSGHDVSALDIVMEVSEYGGCKRLTIEYNDQMFTLAPPPQNKPFTQKMMNTKIDMLYNDYLKARERALDFDGN
ncbi:MAG: hypothetical protein Q4Q20_05000 [Methanocorpusculum sp.]|nr:hypothetical protein [Methanocorpusculum sp.]